MRKTIEKQLKIEQVDICNIQIDLRSRDEIPQLLLGLQAIYKDRQVREEVFTILEGIIPMYIDSTLTLQKSRVLQIQGVKGAEL